MTSFRVLHNDMEDRADRRLLAAGRFSPRGAVVVAVAVALSADDEADVGVVLLEPLLRG